MTQEEIKVQELLKPRYKIIADYPHSPFPVGRLLDGNDESFLVTTTQYQDFGELHFQNNWMPIDYLEKLPHLFRKLEWWEERKPEELIGTFAKRRDGKHITRINAPISNDGAFFLWDNLTNSVLFSDYLPATLADYHAYISSPELK